VSGDLGDFLAEGGAVVGGGAALGATSGFLLATILVEFRPDVDPDVWARRWGFYGGVIGLVVFLDGA
jgi:hypothetical protein